VQTHSRGILIRSMNYYFDRLRLRGRSKDDLVWLCTPWPRVRGQGQRSYDLSKWL